ncbi:hypothetical protein [Chthonomonas calidirosea]|uniref:hypothetical protein n=1 Tax=Chthonomonas calidirosea TaxID=454171 RepID=UPI0012DC00B6|nr:hypothetical protein [Chthonomonas calidirosea]
MVNCEIRWAGWAGTGANGQAQGPAPTMDVWLVCRGDPPWSPDGIHHNRRGFGKLWDETGKHEFPNGQARGPAPTMGVLMCL